MSILINGVEMPKSCLNCFYSRSGCRAVLKRVKAMERGTWIPANYRHDDCPLVNIPPHGRLIDADWVRNDIDKKRPGRSYEDAWALTIIDSAPTIIPAED